ncbi:MAG TPA: acyltransferase [Nitrospira sp.]|nr:acyltransferase [Nitrospira sp.]
MSRTAEHQSLCWTPDQLPPNVRMGANSVITGNYLPGDHPFKRFRSRRQPAIVIGEGCMLNGLYFNMGEEARIEIGNYCHISEAFLLSELQIQIGNYVMVGWHTTLTDADFHPVSPDDRILDAIACSPLAHGQPRTGFARKPVIIEDDVWIGPNVTILKGVRIGEGAFIEPGSVVVRDVPPHARVLGNPAQVIGEI